MARWPNALRFGVIEVPWGALQSQLHTFRLTGETGLKILQLHQKMERIGR